jgi:diketogulonate reductase-like aldo/keto reductase
MPQLGLGTYQSRPGKETRRAVIAALEAGYRLIDTAAMYGNEADVGAAIRESGVSREQVFVTSKLWNDDHGYEKALRAFRETLRRLGTSYLDLYLIHWPGGGQLEETWLALERLQAEGRVRAIGVSNYTISHLKEMLGYAQVPPAVNQVEFHPFMYRRGLLQWTRDRDIALEAYRPLVRARKMHEPTLVAVAHDHDKTVAQVLLRWSLQHGAIVIPKSVHVERIRENLDAFDFALSDAEMDRLDGLDEGSRIT